MSVLTNGMSVFNFLENLRLLSPKTKTYFAATSELLGGDPTKTPFDEDSEYECRSPYSIGKELGTRWVKYYNQTYGMFSTYGILFNHSNNSRGESFFIKRVTKAAARISLGKQNELTLGNINFYRDEHWSDFGVEMMWEMLQLEKPETFLICRGECHHGEQFLEESFGYFNLDWKKYVKVDSSRFRPNEVVKLVGNPRKAINELGWRPNRMSFKDHINLMCKYDYELESGLLPVRPNVFELYPEKS
jgi:GDPmannose 4,6-dehydratase